MESPMDGKKCAARSLNPRSIGADTSAIYRSMNPPGLQSHFSNFGETKKRQPASLPMNYPKPSLKSESKVAPKREHPCFDFSASLNPKRYPMKTQQSLQRVSIDGMRPLALTKKQIVAVLGSAKLVDRMLWATRHAAGQWLTIIREGRDLLVATESVEAAYMRLVRGELPPLMPSERKVEESGTAA